MAVRSGLEIWLEDPHRRGALPRGAKIGLLAHPASIDTEGRHAIERIGSAPNLQLTRLFAPEHGLRGEAQDMESVDERKDPHSGCPIVSLYGEGPDSLRPDRASLKGLDALVIDLQDVGARFYTFIYTMAYCMEAAAPLHLPIFVLDRPNPIGGTALEGPVLDTERWSSFVGAWPLPVRHGMTIGEIALLLHHVWRVGQEPRVVAMEGWTRSMYYTDTGLPWVAPSPNMPSPRTAEVYPGGCLIEGTNLSEGRGTTRPFELIGAPWLNGFALAEALRNYRLPGVIFRATTFRPVFQKHASLSCEGVQVIPVDRDRFRPFLSYMALIRECRRLGGSDFDWRREVYEFESDRLAIDLLLGRNGLRSLLEADAPLREMEESWQSDLDRFNTLRQPYLLYREG
jgi:uncharacterized protein YbbC (DUF1343 family)